MTPLYFVIVLACVLAISSGQILFRKTGLQIEALGMFHPQTIAIALVAFAVYGVASLGWIFVLRKVPLSLAYPFVALSFVLVPLFSRYIFGEPLTMAYFAGAAFIVVGIGVISLGAAA